MLRSDQLPPEILKRKIVFLFFRILRNLEPFLEQDDISRFNEKDNLMMEICWYSRLMTEVRQFIFQIVRSIQRKRSVEELNPMQRCKEYLNRFYMEELSLETVARKFHFNPSYFSTLFKQSFGESFSEYLSSVRMERAVHLLLESDCKVKEIAGIVGYKDSNYFIRSFKKRYGITPDDFRREEKHKMKQLVKKIYNIWKYARLRTWLIVFFCMLSIIPLLTLGICVFRVARGELTIQAQEYFQQNVESTSEILDNDLDYIEEFSLKMNADDRLYEIFQQIDMEDEVELEKASDQIAQILLNYLPWNNSVYSTHLVTSYYRFGEKNKNFYPENSFLTSKMIQKAKEADGKLVWIPTYEYKEMFSVKGLEQVETEYERLFTAVRKLHPSKISSGRIMKLDEKVEEPYLVVNFTEENLKSMLNKYAGGNKEAEYYVVTSEGEIVCSANNKGNFEQIEKEASN